MTQPEPSPLAVSEHPQVDSSNLFSTPTYIKFNITRTVFNIKKIPLISNLRPDTLNDIVNYIILITTINILRLILPFLKQE